MRLRHEGCASCPAAPGHACAALSHPRLCQLAATGEAWRARIRKASGPPAVDDIYVHYPYPHPGTYGHGGHPSSPAPFPPARPRDHRVRVGVISPTCYVGGAELWVGNLLDWCDGARVRWEGIAVRDDSMAVGYAGVPIVESVRTDWEEHCPVGVGPGAIRELARRCDVLVAWGVFQTWGFPADQLAPMIGGTPLLYASHGSMPESLIEPGDLLRATVPAAVSRAALRGVPASMRDRTTIILNAVSPGRVARTRRASETRAILGIPKGARVAGWLGRFSGEKRPDVFIRAVAELPKEWIGVAAGMGWQEEQARELAEAVAPGRIRFVGARSDVGDVLGAFDALCMPSDSEACSLAAAEAWLAGVPLISTPVGLLEDYPGLARLIARGPTGADLARAILADHRDAAGTARRVRHAKAFAGSEMSPATFGRKWTDLMVGMAPVRVSPPVVHSARQWAVANPTPAQKDARLAVLRGQCPHGSRPEGCGCSGELICSLGKGTGTAGRATIQDCFACLRETADVG